jgi:hypothetical protein
MILRILDELLRLTGTSIRLDTCESASSAVSQNFAEQLSSRLKNKYSFKTVKVGTTGSSITGFREGREVVDPASIEEAIAIQNALKVIAGVSGSS